MKPAIVITAGPTRERLDPVRFISNYSTGSFGYAIAEEARRRGYRVTLISGPVHRPAVRGVRMVMVESALQMRQAVLKELAKHDGLIMAAAVSDWRAATVAGGKLKRRSRSLVVRLAANPDIVAEAGKRHPDKVLVGFALETGDLIAQARKKLKEKNLDFIVANRMNARQPVFGAGKTSITLIERSGKRRTYRQMSKKDLSKIILDKVLARII